MIIKLSINNMRKSLHDYTIYFITLTVAVTLSYIFNLLPFQPFMKSLSEGTFANVTMLLTRMSLPMTLIVGGLALYSNNFLLKRRSREIGIYLMLGIKYSFIHFLILLETFFVSVISFICGIALGIGLARIFDLLIVNLLGLKISEASVLFTFEAFAHTLMIFAIIFIFIAIFNYFIISKTKIVNIVHYKERGLLKTKLAGNIYIQSILFCTGIAGILYFYFSLSAPNIDITNKSTSTALVVGLLSHMLLFISGSGILSFFATKNKRKLYRGINLFTHKQIINKVSKNGIILGAISLIMAITMTMLNMGFSSNIWIDENLKYSSPYSFAISNIEPGDPTDDVINLLSEKGYKIKESSTFKMYGSGQSLSYFIDKSRVDKLTVDYQYSIDNSQVEVMKLSDFNKCRKMLGFDIVTLDKSSAALSISKDILPAFLSKSNIEIFDQEFPIEKDGIYKEPISDARGVTGYGVTVILNDDIIDNMRVSPPYSTSIVINTSNKVDERDFQKLYNDIYNLVSKENGGHLVTMQNEMRDYNLGQASTIIFASLFVGLILLIIGASILSLQQMTEISENKKGYDILKKLGVSNRNINGSILKQIFTYFLIPLSVAAIHSVILTQAYSKYSLMTVNEFIFIKSMAISIGIVVIVYLCYIRFTYSRSKKYIGE